jgi:F0F1-type ATP synthase assembly protein I
VKSLAPVLAAGGTFAGTVLLGLLIGILIAQRTGQPLWTLAGLLVGLGIGGYSAVRLLLRSLS